MNKNIQTLKARIGMDSSNERFLSIKGGMRIIDETGIDFGTNIDSCVNSKDCTESSNKKICSNVNVCRSL